MSIANTRLRRCAHDIGRCRSLADTSPRAAQAAVRVQGTIRARSRLAGANTPWYLVSMGTLSVDVAYGGDSFVIVDARAAGFGIVPEEARAMAEAGMRITAAANEQLGFSHPQLPDFNHISFCQFAGPVTEKSSQKQTTGAVVVSPGKIDRSPTGTGVCARMSVLHAKGQMKLGDTLLARSIIGSEFLGRIESETLVGERKAIRPTLTGRAFITGRLELALDPEDPWPQGYRLRDTWPDLTNTYYDSIA